MSFDKTIPGPHRTIHLIGFISSSRKSHVERANSRASINCWFKDAEAVIL